MSGKRAAIIYNNHRNEYELWYQSEVRVHGTDLDAILRWATTHDYDAYLSESTNNQGRTK